MTRLKHFAEFTFHKMTLTLNLLQTLNNKIHIFQLKWLFFILFQNLSTITTAKIHIYNIFAVVIRRFVRFASFVFGEWSASVCLVVNIGWIFWYWMDWWNISNTWIGSGCKWRSGVYWKIHKHFANKPKTKIHHITFPFRYNGRILMGAIDTARYSARSFLGYRLELSALVGPTSWISR